MSVSHALDVSRCRCSPIACPVNYAVLPPATEPTIGGLKTYYALGEKLQANCTLNGSIPVAQLDWKLNNMPVSAHRRNMIGLSTSWELGIREMFEHITHAHMSYG